MRRYGIGHQGLENLFGNPLTRGQPVHKKQSRRTVGVAAKVETALGQIAAFTEGFFDPLWGKGLCEFGFGSGMVGGLLH